MATTKSKITLTSKDLAELQKMTRKEKAELDNLKNLIARQDDLIAQLQDDVNDQKNTCEVLRDECGQLEDKIESYREIIKTIMEITE